MISSFVTTHQTKLRESNVFSRVCLTFCSQGSPCLMCYPTAFTKGWCCILLEEKYCPLTSYCHSAQVWYPTLGKMNNFLVSVPTTQQQHSLSHFVLPGEQIIDCEIHLNQYIFYTVSKVYISFNELQTSNKLYLHSFFFKYSRKLSLIDEKLKLDKMMNFISKCGSYF